MELKRKTALARKATLKRGGQLSASSKNRIRDLARRRQVKKAVFDRDGGCVLSPYRDLNPQGTDWGPCFGEPLTFHHILKASQGGEYTEDNGVTLCAGHNDMVEDYPTAARAVGLVRFSWEPEPCPHENGLYRDGIWMKCQDCDEIAPFVRRGFE